MAITQIYINMLLRFKILFGIFGYYKKKLIFYIKIVYINYKNMIINVDGYYEF